MVDVTIQQPAATDPPKRGPGLSNAILACAMVLALGLAPLFFGGTQGSNAQNSGSQEVAGTFSYKFTNSALPTACPVFNETVYADYVAIKQTPCSTGESTIFAYFSLRSELPPLFVTQEQLTAFFEGMSPYGITATFSGITATGSYTFVLNGIRITANLSGRYQYDHGALVMTNGTRTWYGEADTYTLLSYSLVYPVITDLQARTKTSPFDTLAVLTAGLMPVAALSIYILWDRRKAGRVKL